LPNFFTRAPHWLTFFRSLSQRSGSLSPLPLKPLPLLSVCLFKRNFMFPPLLPTFSKGPPLMDMYFHFFFTLFQVFVGFLSARAMSESLPSRGLPPALFLNKVCLSPRDHFSLQSHSSSSTFPIKSIFSYPFASLKIIPSVCPFFVTFSCPTFVFLHMLLLLFSPSVSP